MWAWLILLLLVALLPTPRIPGPALSQIGDAARDNLASAANLLAPPWPASPRPSAEAGRRASSLAGACPGSSVRARSDPARSSPRRLQSLLPAPPCCVRNISAVGHPGSSRTAPRTPAGAPASVRSDSCHGVSRVPSARDVARDVTGS